LLCGQRLSNLGSLFENELRHRSLVGPDVLFQCLRVSLIKFLGNELGKNDIGFKSS